MEDLNNDLNSEKDNSTKDNSGDTNENSATSSEGSTKQYTAESIRVLEGLEAVRKRPAMYIGSTGISGLHHLVYEIVDNSVDEALAGHCNLIKVIIYTDGSISIEDNGRGIPTDIHPTEKVSAAQVALTKLHAGGKFDKDTYKYSGGLHGVGVSVVNALSSDLYLEIYQNNKIFVQTYHRGKPEDVLKSTDSTTKRGTFIRFVPDSEIFKETTEFNFDTLSARLRELAFLNKGLKIIITDERTNKVHEFYFEGGIVSFVQHINSKKTPLFPDVIYTSKEEQFYTFELAMQYNDGYGEQLYSFVNNINTVEGGSHVTGFKTALTRICNKKALEFNIIKGDDGFSSEDVREGLVAVINMKVADPQFEGQTKTKLGNSEVKGLVESWTFSFLEAYFEENPAIAKKILNKAEIARQAREAAKKAREITRRKNVLESTILPGKLTDCSCENPAQAELFIVEGQSAGGSAKGARDRATQAVLPLRGKILNVEKARFDRILSNEEIKALISAIGCGIGNEEFNVEKARYHKIILMTDADVDGAHIRTLLLTLFFRYMKPLIEKGYLYIAQPPLYRAKIGKKEQYLKDEKAFTKFIFSWAAEQANLLLPETSLDKNDWNNILDKLYQFQIQLEETAQKFKLTYEECYSLIRVVYKSSAINNLVFAQNNNTNISENKELIIQSLKEYFKGYSMRLSLGGLSKEDKLNDELNSDNNNINKEFIVFKKLKYEWQVNIDFFKSKYCQMLADLFRELNILDSTWTLSLIDKDRSISGEGILQLIQAIRKISKPYLSVQRYKGLGEMNADQLGETAMDINTRSLLQVSIGDALQADFWFDVLMGDDPSGRREYVEENGHFVKNLDV